jgi:glycosyltransferase involved in cell wall biosynthesis
MGFRPGAGGIGRVMSNLANGLAQAGARVDLLLPEGDFPDLARLAPAVAAHRLPGTDDRQRARVLAAYLMDPGPVAVLSNRDSASALAVRARGLARSPTRLAFRVGTTVTEKLRRHPSPVRLWRRHRLRRLYRQADVLIANSSGVADDLRALLGGAAPPIETLPNPVDPGELRRLASTPVEHPWLGERTIPVLISVGRLVGAKDYPTLLRAFARVRGRRPCRLIIVGDGGQRERLVRLAGELGVGPDVDLPGYAANPFALVARASLFVLSSRFEGSPNALLEALAVGTPAVATDCRSGPREILGGGRYGPLVPVGDPEALASAILATLEHPPQRHALDQALAPYDAAASVRRYLEVLIARHA